MLKNRVRIIGGQWRGRHVAFHASAHGLRPTPDRVRETLFNWLMRDIPGARCLDLFAGSGILGMEALSRGAAFVCSVEKDPQTLAGIQAALQQLKADPLQWQLEQGNALTWLQGAPLTPPFDIIFIDPPYDANLWLDCLKLVQQQTWLAPFGIVYVESNRPLTEDITASGFSVFKEKKASSVYSYLIATHAS